MKRKEISLIEPDGFASTGTYSSSLFSNPDERQKINSSEEDSRLYDLVNAEQESKNLKDVVIKEAREPDNKKKRKHESKTSGEKDAKRTRIDEDGGTRSPHNITMRDDYFKAFQMLALENGNIHEAWKYLDEACHNYLKSKGLLTK